MGKPDLDALKAEFERQNEALEALAETLAGFELVEVPPAFFAELDEACEVRPPTTSHAFTFDFALRA